MPISDRLENFSRAFASGVGGCRRTCECGKEYYDADNSYSWEEGELEALEADDNAARLSYTVSTVIFEGKEFVIDCDCWHKRAEIIMGFVFSHGRQIIDMLVLEKKRLQQIADDAPAPPETIVIDNSWGNERRSRP